MKVFVLGSCRVHRPIRKLSATGAVEQLNIVDPSWFLHNARAARQSLEIILGKTQPPMHLRDLIFETDDARTIAFQAPEMVQEADLIAVEVCTLNSLVIEGWETNTHRASRATKNRDPRIEGASRGKFTAEDIAADIHEIALMSGKPILVVNHIALTGSPDLDQARAMLTQTLTAAAELTPFALFDTASVLADVQLSDALEDCNHYKGSFELTVGEGILETIRKSHICSPAVL